MISDLKGDLRLMQQGLTETILRPPFHNRISLNYTFESPVTRVRCTTEPVRDWMSR